MKNYDIFARPNFVDEDKSNFDWKALGKNLLTGGLMTPKQLADAKKKKASKNKTQQFQELQTQNNAKEMEKAQQIASLQQQLAEQQKNQREDDAKRGADSQKKSGNTMLYVLIGGVLLSVTAGYFVYRAIKK